MSKNLLVLILFTTFRARAPTLSASTFLQLAGNIRQCVGQTLKFYIQTSRFALLITCFGLLSAVPLSPNFEPYFAPLTNPVTSRACARVDQLFFNFMSAKLFLPYAALAFVLSNSRYFGQMSVLLLVLTLNHDTSISPTRNLPILVIPQPYPG